MAKVKVPKEVLAGITAVRDSGLTNMLAAPVVIRLAREMGFHEAARWIQTNTARYAELVFPGAEVEER